MDWKTKLMGEKKECVDFFSESMKQLAKDSLMIDEKKVVIPDDAELNVGIKYSEEPGESKVGIKVTWPNNITESEEEMIFEEEEMIFEEEEEEEEEVIKLKWQENYTGTKKYVISYVYQVVQQLSTDRLVLKGKSIVVPNNTDLAYKIKYAEEPGESKFGIKIEWFNEIFFNE